MDNNNNNYETTNVAPYAASQHNSSGDEGPVFNHPPTQPLFSRPPAPSVQGLVTSPTTVTEKNLQFNVNENHTGNNNISSLNYNPAVVVNTSILSKEVHHSAEEITPQETSTSAMTATGTTHTQNDATRELHHRLPPDAQESVERLMSFSQYEALPRQYNTGQELEGVVTMLGIKKKKNPLDKEIFLGFLAAIWVTFAGIGSMVMAGGIPAEIRHDWPVLPKLLTAVTFPVGLVFIMLFGGTLFTVTFVDLLMNWGSSFLTNLCTILLMTYLFGYQTGLFEAEPYNSYVMAVAQKKMGLSVGRLILMGIPANALVCLAFFLGYAARDVTGKIIGLYLPIATFAFTGWEHCVADMFYLSLAGYYGAPVTVDKFLTVVLCSMIGNIIGGGILVGFSEHYLYHWHSDKEPTRHAGRKDWMYGRKISLSNINSKTQMKDANQGRNVDLEKGTDKPISYQDDPAKNKKEGTWMAWPFGHKGE